MNTNIKEFAKRVQGVKNFLDSQKLDFMVVGSGALLIHGLDLNRSSHDVDIEVRCEDESVLKALSDAFGNTFYQIKENYPEIGEHKPYIFTIKNHPHQDIIVNAWAVREFSHPYFVTYEEVKYAPVMSVLKRKMFLGRSKDYQDLIFLSKSILDVAMSDKVSLLKEITDKENASK